MWEQLSTGIDGIIKGIWLWLHPSSSPFFLPPPSRDVYYYHPPSSDNQVMDVPNRLVAARNTRQVEYALSVYIQGDTGMLAGRTG